MVSPDNALITNIQRFSLNDGDGIRTTVFFKGCNMNCSWCHNPETIAHHTELLFYENKCIGCGKCYDACALRAHKGVDGIHTIARDICINCGKCAEICYAEALEMCGRRMSVDDIMREVRQDIAYYKNSGGGVTLSGGEVLCQRDFAIALCDAIKSEGISAAVETNLHFDFDFARALLEKCDLIMCDIKLYDDRAHTEHTGVPNKLILDNIKKLDELSVPVIVRTPLIPGITDSDENICAIADYIKNMKNLRRYELLNFNPLGEGKYKALGKPNAHEKARPLSSDRLSHIKELLGASGIKYKIV